MASLLARILKQLLHDLGLHKQDDKQRRYQLDDEIADHLEMIAEQEQRPVDQVASELLSLAIHQRQKDSKSQYMWNALSPREQQVVAYVCLGYTNRQIAASLFISSETVKTYLQNAKLKFGVGSKAELRQVLASWNFSDWDRPLSR